MLRRYTFGDNDAELPLKENLQELLRKKIINLLELTSEKMLPDDIVSRIMRLHNDYLSSRRNKNFTSDRGYEMLKTAEGIKKEAEAAREPEIPENARQKRKTKKPVKRRVTKKCRT